MSDETETQAVDLDAVYELVSSQGYEVTTKYDSVLEIKELESGIVITSVLEENVLFNSVACTTVDASAITLDVARKMLCAENGISTSSFQLYEHDGGKVTVTLNNFCKLQAMGDDDADDILSCLEFLEIDVIAARGVLSDL